MTGVKKAVRLWEGKIQAIRLKKPMEQLRRSKPGCVLAFFLLRPAWRRWSVAQVTLGDTSYQSSRKYVEDWKLTIINWFTLRYCYKKERCRSKLPNFELGLIYKRPSFRIYSWRMLSTWQKRRKEFADSCLRHSIYALFCPILPIDDLVDPVIPPIMAVN